MRNAGLDEAQAGIQIAGRNINNLRCADDTTLMAESEEELKSLWMKMKEESEEVGLKFNIQKTKIMASGPITSWQIDREIMENSSNISSLVLRFLDRPTFTSVHDHWKNHSFVGKVMSCFLICCL